MTMTIVEAARGVTGGVDTHLDVHVAAALDPLEHSSAPSASRRTPWLQGVADLARELRQVTKIGVEGTGSMGPAWPVSCAEPTSR